MIKMAEKTVRLIESIKNEGFNKGRMKLIKNNSIEEIADFLCIITKEVQKYLEM